MKTVPVTSLIVFLFLSLQPATAADAPRNIAEGLKVHGELNDKPTLGWTHESALGVTLNGGNSQSQSILARQTTSYTWSFDVLRTSGHYLMGQAQGQQVARNWDAGLRYEHYFADNFAGLAGNNWSGDTFAGYDMRASADLGAKYYLYGRSAKGTYLFNETGYRFQHEVRVPGQPLRVLDNHFGRVYFEGRTDITDSVYARAWVELLPNLSRPQHYLINFEPSLGIMLTRALSLKLAYTGAYDGQPAAGKKKFDYIYITSLVASY